MGDGGYQDTFNRLKQQIDFNYEQYKVQLASIDSRKEELKKEKRDKGLIVLGIFGMPFLLYGITMLFALLGSMSGFFGIFYMIFAGLTGLSVVAGVFYFFPAAVRNYLNSRYRYKVLCLGEMDDDVKQKKEVVTFDDEEIYLLGRITSIDRFNERVRDEGLNHGEKNIRLVQYGEMTDYAKQVLNEMREKSVFREYRATNASMRREAGVSWIVIGLGILVAVVVIMGYML